MERLKAFSLLWFPGAIQARRTEVVVASLKVKDCTGRGLVRIHSYTGCLVCWFPVTVFSWMP